MNFPMKRYWRLALVAALAVTAGCQQKMADQPSYSPLRASEFFADGRSARQPVPGTVARGRLHDDDAFYTGKAGPAQYVTEFPFAMTEAVLKRGQQRYGIYCSMCHGALGDGYGKIVERGFTRPPSYITDLSRGYEHRGIKMPLRDAPIGYFFDVITNGYGAMASYKEQINPRDRWAIAGYIRVLQQAGGARVAEGAKP